MPHPVQWDDEPYSMPLDLYPSKKGLALTWLAVSLVVIGLCISGWQALAFAFHSETSQELAAIPPHANLGNLHQLQNSMSLPSKAPTLLSQGGMTDDSIKRELHDPLGRPDPFSPLVREPDPAAATAAAPPVIQRDILQDVSYTGFIGDTRSANKVAIIHISDPNAGETTVIKKAGEAFTVEGQRVIVRTIDANGVRVHMGGDNRFLTLQSYQSVSPTAGTPGLTGGGPLGGGGGGMAGSPSSYRGTRAPASSPIPAYNSEMPIPGGASLQDLPR